MKNTTFHYYEQKLRPRVFEMAAKRLKTRKYYDDGLRYRGVCGAICEVCDLDYAYSYITFFTKLYRRRKGSMFAHWIGRLDKKNMMLRKQLLLETGLALRIYFKENKTVKL